MPFEKSGGPASPVKTAPPPQSSAAEVQGKQAIASTGATSLRDGHEDHVRGFVDYGSATGTDIRPSDLRPSSDTTQTRADAPRATIAQIVDVARRMPDGPVEISLSPEELGKVRLSLQGSDLQMTVQIIAERPETLDLIRRHIDLLAADLRQQGFGSLSFSFGQGDTSAGRQETERPPADDTGPGSGPMTPVSVAIQQYTFTRAGAAGLDLRL